MMELPKKYCILKRINPALNRLLLLLLCGTFLLLSSCREQINKAPAVTEQNQTSKGSYARVPDNAPFENGPLETRTEMIDALLYLEAIDRMQTLEFYHVERASGGLGRPCPEDDNGSISFLGNTQDPPGLFYEFPGPVMEHLSQDQFSYWIDQMFYLANDQKLFLELSFIEQGPKGPYIDQAQPKTKLTLWQYKNLGALIEMEGKLYLNEAHYRSLPDINCPDYQP